MHKNIYVHKHIIQYNMFSTQNKISHLLFYEKYNLKYIQ
jgi:hypothetical protein